MLPEGNTSSREQRISIDYALRPHTTTYPHTHRGQRVLDRIHYTDLGIEGCRGSENGPGLGPFQPGLTLPPPCLFGRFGNVGFTTHLEIGRRGEGEEKGMENYANEGGMARWERNRGKEGGEKGGGEGEGRSERGEGRG